MPSSSSQQPSRTIPLPLRKLLDADIKLTNNLVTFAYSKYPQLRSESWKSVMKMLEISAHGVPWLAISLISIYMFKSTHNTAVNLLLALLYDLALVATLKAVTRRPRPPSNSSQMFLTIGPDKLSFPSGHASRAILLTLMLINLTSDSSFIVITVPVLTAWSVLICGSRVVMRRHHVLDVVCGVVLGVLEWGLVSCFWAGDGVTSWIGRWVGGGEDGEYDDGGDDTGL